MFVGVVEIFIAENKSNVITKKYCELINSVKLTFVWLSKRYQMLDRNI